MTGRPPDWTDLYHHDLGHALIDLGENLIRGRGATRPDRIANRLHRLAHHAIVRAARDGWRWGAYPADPDQASRHDADRPLDADLEDALVAWADALAALRWDPGPWAAATAVAVLTAVGDVRDPGRPFRAVVAA